MGCGSSRLFKTPGPGGSWAWRNKSFERDLENRSVTARGYRRVRRPAHSYGLHFPGPRRPRQTTAITQDSFSWSQEQLPRFRWLAIASRPGSQMARPAWSPESHADRRAPGAGRRSNVLCLRAARVLDRAGRDTDLVTICSRRDFINKLMDLIREEDRCLLSYGISKAIRSPI